MPASDSQDRILRQAASELSEYFDGNRTSFNVPLMLPGTEFQQNVWNQLRDIPAGSTRTYGEIGEQAGIGKVGRAVGGAVGANPVPIIVPCHRVLSANGKITGYSAGAGVDTKRWLLAHEGVAVRPNTARDVARQAAACSVP
jgi:methylated-DNA-[protein]-cysteine S-methyltransferase